jgi:hypothetical protein
MQYQSSSLFDRDLPSFVAILGLAGILLTLATATLHAESRDNLAAERSSGVLLVSPR